MSEPIAARIEEVADSTTPRGRWARPVDSVALSVGPILLAMLTCGILLLAIGRDPVAFLRDTLDAGVFSKSGLPDAITRMAPILLIGAGLIVAFRGSLWNLGGNGQYLLAFAVVAGTAPSIMAAMPTVLGWVIVCLVAMAVGAAWTLVPSLLKVRYGLNEIVTSLMMTFIGINLANLLVKGVFRGSTGHPPDARPRPGPAAGEPARHEHPYRGRDRTRGGRAGAPAARRAPRSAPGSTCSARTLGPPSTWASVCRA